MSDVDDAFVLLQEAVDKEIALTNGYKLQPGVGIRSCKSGRHQKRNLRHFRPPRECTRDQPPLDRELRGTLFRLRVKPHSPRC